MLVMLNGGRVLRRYFNVYQSCMYSCTVGTYVEGNFGSTNVHVPCGWSHRWRRLCLPLSG